MKHLLATSLILLAACSGSDEAGNNSADQAGQVIEQTPSNLQDDPTNSVVPLTTPAAPAASPSPVSTTLPTTLQGRWGLVANDCDPKMDYAAKGLMTVSGDTLKFYESRGRVTAARQPRPNTLEVDLAFSGEGQEWTRRSTLTLADDGRTLLVETPKDPEPPMRSLRYTRCPA